VQRNAAEQRAASAENRAISAEKETTKANKAAKAEVRNGFSEQLFRIRIFVSVAFFRVFNGFLFHVNPPCRPRNTRETRSGASDCHLPSVSAKCKANAQAEGAV
jgi:hypothetical protein